MFLIIYSYLHHVSKIFYFVRYLFYFVRSFFRNIFADNTKYSADIYILVADKE